VVDFDVYNVPGIEGDTMSIWRNALPDLPLVYTPHNGGHWIVARAEDIEAFFRDVERISSSSILIPAHESKIKMLPSQSDPPDHAFYRKSVVSFFTAAAIDAREKDIRAFAIELTERIKPKGECDFIAEFANELPFIMFLRILDLPVEDRVQLRESTEKMVFSSDPHAKTEGFEELQSYLAARLEARRTSPVDDLMSSVVHAKLDGRSMTGDEALGLCTNLLLGSVDTVAGLLGHITRYLAQDPAQRQYIRENPDKLTRIVHELTRRFALVSTGRVVKVDHEYKGVPLKKGDMVLLPTMIHSADEKRFRCPREVDFARKMSPNLTFGSGIHTCIGNVLARAEIKIFLEEWLTRIPEFQMKPRFKQTGYSGAVNGFHELWLEWPQH